MSSSSQTFFLLSPGAVSNPILGDTDFQYAQQFGLEAVRLELESVLIHAWFYTSKLPETKCMYVNGVFVGDMMCCVHVWMSVIPSQNSLQDIKHNSHPHIQPRDQIPGTVPYDSVSVSASETPRLTAITESAASTSMSSFGRRHLPHSRMLSFHVFLSCMSQLFLSPSSLASQLSTWLHSLSFWRENKWL